jgi:hypothetical protein
MRLSGKYCIPQQISNGYPFFKLVIPFDRDLLYQEKENLFKDFSRGTSEVRDLLEKEKEDIRLEVFCSIIILQRNPIYVFLEKKLRGLSPNFHTHVSVSDLYIPTIGPLIFLQQNRQTNCGYIEIA